MNNPAVTYRIQFHKDFTLTDLEKIIPYLKKLGIGTLYASPVFTATPGSTHGYDGTNPNEINPEIGTIEQLKSVSGTLRKDNIGWLQDIVPNHMAFHTANKWLMDVLQKGEVSEYYSFFDILDGKLMVPFLGEDLQEAINTGKLFLAKNNDELFLQYADTLYPVNSETYTLVQDKGTDQVNKDTRLLNKIVEQQHYRLCKWDETDHKINYRRFFTINGLICLNIQDANVFDCFHKLIKKLLDKKVITGLRVDHIDGMYDPTRYLSDLRDLAGDSSYITVEKILSQDEKLPSNWPVQGNTGYDFLAMVNNLLTDNSSKESFTNFHNEVIGSDVDPEAELYKKKSHILFEHMEGELNNLVSIFKTIGIDNKPADDEIKTAIANFLIVCPVYRLYGNKQPLEENEINQLKEIFSATRKNFGSSKALDALEYIWCNNEHNYNASVMHLYQRCMQLTGPLMAKGNEDTLMYTYSRFIGHNDVGDSVADFGITPDHFHNLMTERQTHSPLSQNATSTHDTKRGEDVRARLNVITELPDIWQSLLKNCFEQYHSSEVDANDKYFIFQTIVGSFPLTVEELNDTYKERLKAYFQKAFREAKTHTGWSTPNEKYETAVNGFIDDILNPNGQFITTIYPFQEKINDFGIVNSLSQLLLKFTCPGVPDLYQGTELWDLSLVDPDNRRSVDYDERTELLNKIENFKGDSRQLLKSLWEQRNTGIIKLWLTQLLCKVRTDKKDLFTTAEYTPLQIEGEYKEHVFAFARQHGTESYITVIPYHIAKLARSQGVDINNIKWGNTSVVLEDKTLGTYKNLITNETINKDKIAISELLDSFPVALLQRENTQANVRGAGILLSVTSLSTAFGIGDLGKSSFDFVNFLIRCRQKYWQLLPLNLIDADSSYSPYSSISAMAGNIYLISPEELNKIGLLTKEELNAAILPVEGNINYEQAISNKSRLLNIAYQRFIESDFVELKRLYQIFCRTQAYWLDDFALFSVISDIHTKSWVTWPDNLKYRNTDILLQFGNQYAQELDKVKWFQFIFSAQWQSLRAYANNKGIKLIGDVPFYVNHESADVWAHPDIFCLKDDLTMSAVAGVPPDYFSETGQLWGMPTYNWTALKQQNYDWWLTRLKKNIQLFDLVRLDHFRAFDEYWEVPYGETTAINGKWLSGPCDDFFVKAKEVLDDLPLIAEDLGDNMDKVYALRDRIGLPGMKVLQFAFGDDAPKSVDIPHNYKHNCIVYPGTHDNNTTVGWYQQESDRASHKRLEQYTGIDVNEENIHIVLMRMAYASIANTAIVQMQDILGLDSKFRMNTPGTSEHNWEWRLQPNELSRKTEDILSTLVTLYNRR